MFTVNLLTAAAHLSSFNELLTSYQIAHSRLPFLIHTLIHKSRQCVICEQRKLLNVIKGSEVSTMIFSVGRFS